MAFTYSGVTPTDIIFDGTHLTGLVVNGVCVWGNAPNQSFTTLTISNAGTYNLTIYKDDTQLTQIFINEKLTTATTTQGECKISITTPYNNSVVKILNKGIWKFSTFCLSNETNNNQILSIDFSNESNLSTIGYKSFRNSRITNVVIPSSATTIEHLAFSNCNSLTTVDIPSTSYRLGTQIFNLSNFITSIYFRPTELYTKASIASMSPFYGCGSSAVIYASSTLNATTAKTQFGRYWLYRDSSNQLPVYFTL